MKCSACSIIYHITSIIQIALAIAIVVIVAVYLTDVSTGFSGVSYTCLMGTDVGSSSLCTYTYIVCGISLAISAVASLLECCTCNLCGLGKVLDVIVAGFGAVWWAVASGVIGTNTSKTSLATDSASVQQWRDAVPIMAYVETGLFIVLFISGIFRVCKCCLG